MTDKELDAIEERAERDAVVWACETCGPHGLSGPNWCAVGCGRDYRRMQSMTAASQDVPSLVAEVRRLRAGLGEVVDWNGGEVAKRHGNVGVREFAASVLVPSLVETDSE